MFMHLALRFSRNERVSPCRSSDSGISNRCAFATGWRGRLLKQARVVIVGGRTSGALLPQALLRFRRLLHEPGVPHPSSGLCSKGGTSSQL